MAKRKAKQSSTPGEQHDPATSEDLTAIATIGNMESGAKEDPPPAKRQRRNNTTGASSTFDKQAQKSVTFPSQEDSQYASSPVDGSSSCSLPPAANTASTSSLSSQDDNSSADILTAGVPTADSTIMIAEADASGGIASATGLNVLRDYNEQPKTATKKVRGATSKALKIKAPRKQVVKGATTQDNPEPPKLKRIQKIVKAKVQQVNDFLRANLASVLEESPTNGNHVVVTEAVLMSALMAMHADYCMSEDTGGLRATLLDARDVIEGSFRRPLGTLRLPVEHHVVDLSKQSMFEQGIKIKVRGHLENEHVNLLRVQLEMIMRRIEKEAAASLVRHFVAFYDEEDTDGVEEGQKNTAGDTVVRMVVTEINRRGVCPAPRA